MSANPAFSELELSLLELARTRKITEEDVQALKNLWARYFMMKATDAADKTWEERSYSNETIANWIKGNQ